MDWISVAFEKTWFFVGTLVIAAIYGLGGLVHIGNMLGLGEMKWTQAPLSWKVGDIVWGTLDVIAVVGIVMRAPIGILAVTAAAMSQIFIYGLAPNLFALNDEHRSTLRGMVYFHVVILVVLGVLLYFARPRIGA